MGAAHSIADGENKMMVSGDGIADFSEAVDFEGIELEGEEGVLVVGADFAAVGVAGPADVTEGKGGGHGWGGGSGRMLANSKSMMQKRPSLWR